MDIAALPNQPSSPDIETLYCDHHRWLQGWLRRRLGDSFDAADLAHDTFVRILSGRRIDNIKEPRAYLTTVARGILVNWYERKALERAYLEALALLPEPETPSPEHRQLILETLHQIDTMLDTLPTRVRRAFLMSQIEGLRYEQIASKLGCSLISVKRYMKQAFLQCLALLD
ncbi:sigma-70 family RNA polymerase sigma factor [Allopusillimonas ginsengisoli]|uniref:sigma-70 family RNA polymerase sigma factor n=1 Tax=Allopusillimonas ginsengisoli TaxID=453575 RepID=UPI00101FB1D1|nr:sigma-70 family RNA polymerase sigma factor [Allopusillimonas ginsengisoli]TEA78857.1 sigma-70 family RNA polymerase sigma factor [Allopusillimonas ginsengisoli]